MKRVCLILVTLFLGALPICAQDPTEFDNGFIPYQTYDISNFDSVNLLNENLVIHIPVISYPQRGKVPDFSLAVIGNRPVWATTCTYTPYYHCNWEPVNDYGLTVVRDNALHYTYNAYDNGNGDYYYTNYAIDSSGAVHPMGATSSSGSMETIDASGIGTLSTGGLVDRNGIQYVYYYNYNTNTMTDTTTDPDGNQIVGNFTSGYIPTGWTDTVGRTIPPLPYVSSTGDYTEYFPGPNGNVAITFRYDSVLLYTNFNVPYCPYCVEYPDTYQTMLTSVTLPNNTKWSFAYDHLANLTSVTTPTGGTVTYTWTSVFSQPGGIRTEKFQVNTRAVYDGTQTGTWTYSFGSSPMSVTDPVGNVTLHTFTSLTTNATPVETETQFYDNSSNLLKTVELDYSWAGLDPFRGADGDYSLYDLVPKRTTTIWPSGQVSQVCFIYDDSTDTGCSGSGTSADTYNSSGPAFYDPNCTSSCTQYPLVYGSQVRKYEYDYWTPSGGYTYGTASPNSPLRSTVNDFKWLDSSSYLNANLISLPSSSIVYSGTVSSGNMAAQTTYTYDESAYAPSSCSSTPCGDLTTVNNYVSSSGYLTTHTWYNSNGMPTKLCASIDTGCSNPTQYSYDSTGMFPNEIQSPTTNGGSTTHIDYPTYNSSTGLLTSNQDQNGQTTTYGYDSMRRLTSVSDPVGGSESFCYTDTSSTSCSSTVIPSFVFTKAINSSTNLVEVGILDGLGRKKQTQLTSDPSGTDSVDYTYDKDGRLSSVSNPHRSTGSPTDGTTTYNYDALNRITSVVEQDTSTSSTSYSNFPCITVTDEASKSRKSCFDGLGRSTGVWEDPSGSNFETDYTYNALDNLTGVSQGSQTRSFSYDMLSRLNTATNPESGTICYGTYSGSTCQSNGYDANGNVLYKTDARNITTTYAYDALNRLISKSYSDSTPGVKYGYDAVAPSGCTPPSLTITNGKGRRTSMCDEAGATAWTFDAVGNVLTEKRTTSSVTDSFTYTYNLDKTIVTVGYPSGRTITYASGGAELPLSAIDITNSINYATSATYAPPGELTSVQNGAYLLSTYYYNNRLQPCRTAINSSGTAPSSCGDGSHTGNVMDLSYSFNAGSSDNGNVLGLTNSIDTTRSQSFTYDSLNRIATAAASTYATSPSHCLGETFTIDRYGNLTGIGSISSAYTGCTQENLSILASSSTNQITTTGFTYDSSGNMTSDGINSPSYDAENHMTSDAGVTYTYDGDGKRVEKTYGGAIYKIYWYGMSGDALDESDGGGNITDEYVFFGGKRIARRKVQ